MGPKSLARDEPSADVSHEPQRVMRDEVLVVIGDPPLGEEGAAEVERGLE
jgi:hypothetical protein